MTLRRWAVGCAVAGAFLLMFGCGHDSSTRPTSLVTVLADPSRFEGRELTLRGYVHLERNESALYLSVEDYRWGVTANSVWLHMPRCANRAGQSVTDGYMTVVGNFTRTLHGYADGWVGEVDDIKLCRLIEGVDGEPRPRPTSP